jgi:SynChlorMet cassette radical SAM/SPASM protein ScmF
MLRLAETLGASSIKYNILQPMARGEKMHNAGEAIDIEELIKLGKWVEEELSHSTKLRLHYSHPLAFRSLENMFGKSGDGCSVCGIFHILGVLSDGTYALCGIGETIPEFIFGNASKDRIEDIWNNSPVLKELRKGLPEHLKGICQDCLMKHGCIGNCVAQNYYMSKDLLAPFWYCEEAEKRNLFPETRKIPKNAG